MNIAPPASSYPAIQLSPSKLVASTITTIIDNARPHLYHSGIGDDDEDGGCVRAARLVLVQWQH
jgi:hypothetical protein